MRDPTLVCFDEAHDIWIAYDMTFNARASGKTAAVAVANLEAQLLDPDGRQECRCELLRWLQGQAKE